MCIFINNLPFSNLNNLFKVKKSRNYKWKKGIEINILYRKYIINVHWIIFKKSEVKREITKSVSSLNFQGKMAADELLTSEFQFTLALFQISLIAVITAGVGCIIVKIYQYLKAEGLLGGKKDTGEYPDAFIRLIEWFYYTHAAGCILMLVMHGD